LNISIRDALKGDVDTIAEFNARLAQETEGSMLDPGVVKAGVLAVVENPTRGRYWVAEADGRIVGQIQTTFEWSDWRNGMLWWIQSVYVHPDFRRRGIYSTLYRHVESLASRQPDVCGIRLYVERDNEPAQQTYSALGMSMTDYRVMERLFNGEN
jgi:ribosomal protein S18 acetylase RimI-like enzyme